MDARDIGNGPVFAAPASAQPPAEPGDAIVVTGQRGRRRGDPHFIDDVTIVSDGQIAAFDAALCPAGYGLPPAHNLVVAALIRQAAVRARIRVAAAPCRPNVVVIVAEDGADLLALLRRARPALFDGAGRAQLAANWRRRRGRSARGRSSSRAAPTGGRSSRSLSSRSAAASPSISARRES